MTELQEDRFAVFCECVEDDCRTEIWISLDEWDRAKAAPGRLVVALGHRIVAGALIVLETDRFAVIELGPATA